MRRYIQYARLRLHCSCPQAPLSSTFRALPVHQPPLTSISFMSFMASMMHTVWPFFTLSPSLQNAGSPGAGLR